MKRIIVFCLAAVSLVQFYGCKKTPTPKTLTPKTTSSHFLSATTTGGGVIYSTGSQLNASGSLGGNFKIEANSMPDTFPQCNFGFIACPTLPGTYIIDNVSIFCSYITSAPIVLDYAVYGTITFTSITPDMIGSFAFTQADSTHITGSFNVAAP